MSKRFLLVNPWITDTAAYNFWIRPLGLYRLASWLDERGAESVLVDCLSPAPAPGRFPAWEISPPDSVVRAGIRRRFRSYGISVEEFVSRLKRVGKVDAVLVTSAMSYWYHGVQMAVECVRKVMPGVPIMAGGVYPTLWPGHAAENSGADYVFQGPIESCGPLLSSILSLDEKPIRRAMAWYRLGLHDGADFSALRSAAGCPFSCAYCASRRVSGTFRPRLSIDILQELEALYEMGVTQVCFYDDALLVDFDTRLRPVLEAVISRRMNMVFHTPNGMHAGLIDTETAALLYTAGFRTVRISLETVDEKRQQSSGGKVVSRDVKKAVGFLTQAGYRAEDIGVYLLAGLPDQSVREVISGIEFIRSLEAKPFISELSPIPGTSVWEEFRKKGVVSPDMDPVLTNNSLFYQWSGFCTHDEFQRVKMMCRQG